MPYLHSGDFIVLVAHHFWQPLGTHGITCRTCHSREIVRQVAGCTNYVIEATRNELSRTEGKTSIQVQAAFGNRVLDLARLLTFYGARR
jgi:hypothetical protein